MCFIYLNRGRNFVELFSNNIKQCRCVAAHHDKFAVYCFAFVHAFGCGFVLVSRVYEKPN